jgi:hypothetical protein
VHRGLDVVAELMTSIGGAVHVIQLSYLPWTDTYASWPRVLLWCSEHARGGTVGFRAGQTNVVQTDTNF